MNKLKPVFSTFFLSVILTLGLVSCGPKDADVQNAATAKLKDNASFQNVSVSVDKGVATLNGEVMSDADKSAAEETVKPVDGVKSVVNNISVQAPPPPPSVDVSSDSTLNASVDDAIKDHPGVKASVNDGVITLTGEINKSDLPTLMQKLAALNPKKIDNQLTVK